MEVVWGWGVDVWWRRGDETQNNQAFVPRQPRGSQIHLASALRVSGRGASGEGQNAVAPDDQSGR